MDGTPFGEDWPQAQGKQISETEGSLNVQPIVEFKSDADRECRRGKTL